MASDKDLEISIKVTSDAQGAEQASQALEKVTAAGQQVSGASEEMSSRFEALRQGLAEHKSETESSQAATIDYAQALASAGFALGNLPGPLGELGQALTVLSGGPMEIAVSAVSALIDEYAKWSKEAEESTQQLQDLAASEGKAVVDREALTAATKEATTAEQARSAALKETLSDIQRSAEQAEFEIGQIERVEAARRRARLAQIEADVAAGRQTPEAGAAEKAALEAESAEDAAQSAKLRRQAEVSAAAEAARIQQEKRDRAEAAAQQAGAAASGTIEPSEAVQQRLRAAEAQRQAALEDLKKFGTTSGFRADGSFGEIDLGDPSNRGFADRNRTAEGVAGTRQNVLDRIGAAEAQKERAQDAAQSDIETERLRRQAEAVRARQEADRAREAAAEATQRAGTIRERAAQADNADARISEFRQAEQQAQGESRSAAAARRSQASSSSAGSSAADSAAESARGAAQGLDRVGSAVEKSFAALAKENQGLKAKVEQLEKRFAAMQLQGNKR